MSQAGARWAVPINFHALIDPLADKLGAASARARRGGRGLCANDYQVGQTGKIAPPTCTSRSGFRAQPAPRRNEGQQGHVATNKDEDARSSGGRRGLVGDLFKIVPS